LLGTNHGGAQGIFFNFGPMSFLYPVFLYALAAIAIPIIIHLFNFQRYKTLVFTNVRFLREVKQQTKQQSQLKHWLVLLARILFIVFLVLGFAQPFIPVAEETNHSAHTVSIFLDNSFSMNANNEEGRLFDQSRRRVEEIISAYKPTDRFQLLTHDFESKHQFLVNGKEAMNFLDQISITPSVKPLSHILSRQKDLMSNGPNSGHHSYIVSDFQKQITDFDNISPDSSMQVRLVPVTPQDGSNIYVDTCWFTTPVREANKPDLIVARIRNSSDESFENLPVKLLINNQQKALASCNVQPNSFTDVPLHFQLAEPGIKHCVVTLSDHPVTFDNQYYLSYSIESVIAVTSIADTSSNPFIGSFFGNDPQFVLRQELSNAIDYSSLAKSHFIILSELESISTGLAQELEQFIKSGGSLAVFPNPDADLGSYADFLEGNLGVSSFQQLDTSATEVTTLNLQHSLFKDVFENVTERIDLPLVHSHYTLTQIPKGQEERIATLKDGAPFITEHQVEKGTVFLFTVPLRLEFTNLPEHALFVPIAYNMAINSIVEAQYSAIIGKDNSIRVRTGAEMNGDQILHLTNWSDLKDQKPFEIMPEHHTNGQFTMVSVHGEIKEAGNYQLQLEGKTIAGISFNYDRKESGLSCFEPQQLEMKAEEYNLSNFTTIESQGDVFSHALTEINEGEKLWKLCIIFALAFLGIEILLLRFWK